MRKFYLFFSKVQILVLGVQKVFFFFSFWLIFYPLDPYPWIRILLRIRVLSTALGYPSTLCQIKIEWEVSMSIVPVLLVKNDNVQLCGFSTKITKYKFSSEENGNINHIISEIKL